MFELGLTAVLAFTALSLAVALGLGDCFKGSSSTKMAAPINVDSSGPPPAKLGGGAGPEFSQMSQPDQGVPSLMKFKGMTNDGILNNREAPETVANRGGFNPMSVQFSNITDFRGDKIKMSTRVQDDRAKSHNGGSGLMISPGLDKDDEEEEEEDDNEEEEDEDEEDGGFQGQATQEVAPPLAPSRVTVKGRPQLPSVDPNTGTFRTVSESSREGPPGMGSMSILNPSAGSGVPSSLKPVPVPPKASAPPPKPRNNLEDDLEMGIKTFDPRVNAVKNAVSTDNGAFLKSLNFTKEQVQQSFSQQQMEEEAARAEGEFGGNGGDDGEEDHEHDNSAGGHSKRKKKKVKKMVKKRANATGSDGMEHSKKKKKKKKVNGEDGVHIEAI